MSVAEILLPLFVQVVLTFAILYRMAWLRSSALNRREVAMADIALRQPGWPPRILKLGNCFQNQFELPVLFYVLVILALITRTADFLFVVLAWIFVISRIVHAGIHVTYNHVRHRGLAFAVGCAVLTLMWVIFMVRILAVH